MSFLIFKKKESKQHKVYAAQGALYRFVLIANNMKYIKTNTERFLLRMFRLTARN